MDFSQTIRSIFLKNRSIASLLLHSECRSGPLDGGCLIVAKAFQLALDEGSLVRIVSSPDLTEHYGLQIGSRIIDALGIHTRSSWTHSFAIHAECPKQELRVATGFDATSIIPDDPHASKILATIIRRTFPIEGLRMEVSQAVRPGRSAPHHETKQVVAPIAHRLSRGR